MTGKEIRDLIILYMILFIAGSVLFVASFRMILFKNLDVFFYRGLCLILFWGILSSGAMALLKYLKNIKYLEKWRKIITIRDIILFFTAFCCVHTVLFTHLPVTADRSISVFMLGHFADHPDEIFTEQEIEEYFINRYVRDYGAFSKRFHEQEETGTIQRVGDGYQITRRGRDLMRLYEKIAVWFDLDQALIHSDVDLDINESNPVYFKIS